jgi:6 kDa early secretory antigenic target
MPKITVDTEAVTGASANVQQTFDQFEQALTALNGRITALEAEYQGPDGQSLQALFAEYHAQAQALNTTLQRIGQAMNTAAQNYTETNAANVRMFTV